MGRGNEHISRSKSELDRALFSCSWRAPDYAAPRECTFACKCVNCRSRMDHPRLRSHKIQNFELLALQTSQERHGVRVRGAQVPRLHQGGGGGGRQLAGLVWYARLLASACISDSPSGAALDTSHHAIIVARRSPMSSASRLVASAELACNSSWLLMARLSSPAPH